MKYITVSTADFRLKDNHLPFSPVNEWNEVYSTILSSKIQYNNLPIRRMLGVDPCGAFIEYLYVFVDVWYVDNGIGIALISN